MFLWGGDDEMISQVTTTQIGGFSCVVLPWRRLLGMEGSGRREGQ